MAKLEHFPDSYPLTLNINKVNAAELKFLPRSDVSKVLLKMAESGNFGKLTAQDLTAYVALRDPNGESFVHAAAKCGKLTAFPPGFLDRNTLLLQDHLGATPFIFAARYGSLDQIPKKFFTNAMLIGEHEGFSVLHAAAHYGTLQQCPASAFSHSSLRSLDKDGQTVFHLASEFGNIKQLPPVYVTANNMSYFGDCGESPIHVAASCATLSELPKQLLIPRLLSKKTAEGKTVYHMAAEYDCIGQIPSVALKPDYLLQPDKYLQTPLHYAVNGGCLEQLLGVSLPVAAKVIVGDEWWAKNESVVASKHDLKQESCTTTEIDLF